jgi:type III secretion protein D
MMSVIAEPNRLEVLTGLNSGGTLTMIDGFIVLGSDEECDVVLLDTCVAPRHATVEFIEGEAQVVAQSEGVVLAGHPLPKGRHRILRLPFVLALADVELAFSQTDAGMSATSDPPPWQAALTRLMPAPFAERLRPPGRRAVWAIGAVLMGLMLYMMISPLLTTPQPQNSRSVVAGSAMPPQPAAPRRVVASTTRASSDDIARAADGLRRDLASALPLMQVSAVEDGVRVEGPLAPEDMRRWEAIARRFDERHAGRISILKIDEGRSARAERLPRIEAVWAGEKPFVMVEGTRYFIGQAIEGGWTFQKLTPNEIILARGGGQVTVPY